VLVDRPGVGRSHREAPEIDGVIRLAPSSIPGVTGDGAGTSLPGDPAGASLPCDPAGRFVEVEITGAEGPDLEARPLPAAATTRRH
jgi:hypothetical protein